jgi:Ni/Co efflux regulator RcnB
MGARGPGSWLLRKARGDANVKTPQGSAANNRFARAKAASKREQVRHYAKMRQRRHRERQRHNLSVLRIEFDTFLLSDVLSETGRLAESDIDDLEAVADAAAQVLKEWLDVTRYAT